MIIKKNRKIKKALIDEDMTARDLAHDVGLHETKLSLIVNGRMIPTDSEADRIAKALNRNPDELFN
jgi:plasmid maintenance system antidote protein VapI